MFWVLRDTVLKLQVEAGYRGADYHERTFRGLTCKRIQSDEVWVFCYAKAKNFPDDKQGQFGYGMSRPGLRLTQTQS